MPAALIASPVIGPVRNCATSSRGIEGRPATTRSSFLVRLGIRRLLGVGYAPHTESRTGSRERLSPALRPWGRPEFPHQQLENGSLQLDGGVQERLPLHHDGSA